MVPNPISWLFDAAPYVPRRLCGDWPTWLICQSVASDVAIFAAYEAIPAVLYWAYRHRRTDFSRPFRWVARLFIVFIAACGLTHLDDVAVFWWPAYRLFVAIKAFTGVVSLAAMVLAIPVARQFVRMPTFEQYRRKAELLEGAYDELAEINVRLRDRNEWLESRRRAGHTHVTIDAELAEIRHMLDRVSQ